MSVRIGEITIPVGIGNAIELTNLKRKWRGQPLLPEDNTQDNLKISFNSEDYREDLVNITFLAHLQYDILIPYPCTAWMQGVIPDKSIDELHSVNYFQKINGDCELTHAMEDLYRIMKVGGTAYVSVPNIQVILRKIIDTVDENARLKWEHFLYSRNVDEKGLFYNQSACDARRIRSRAYHAGFRGVTEDTAQGDDVIKYLDMQPEQFNLPGVTEEVRAKRLTDKEDRRKMCTVPGCPAKSGQQEFQRTPSVYCRRHFRKAKAKLIEMQERALRLTVVLKKE